MLVASNLQHMRKEICVDLRIARSRSGLSGNDLAHLMGCGKDRISKLENGAARITPQEIALLYMVFGEPFEQTFGILCQSETDTLFAKLGSMPQEPVQWAGRREQRLRQLDDLSARLQARQSPAQDG